jgi:hypothetical protein
MTEYSDLIARVRSPFALTERDAQEISDALEAQAKEIADSKEWAAKVEDANDWLIERNRTLEARIAELEKENGRLRDLAYIAYQNGYKDAPPYSKYERSLDEIELMWKRSFAYAALKGERG